jgi:MFS family permease
VLMASSVLVKASTFYFTATLGLDTTAAGTLGIVVLVVIVAGNVVAVVPAARISDRVGRKPVIYVACALGAAGTAIVAAVASTDAILVALFGAALFGIGSGAFLAVDWALMTDIIPKAASGRYMGISNVATASAGVVAVAVALGLVMDKVGATFGTALGPRAALLVGIVAYGIGALLLRPVREHRVEPGPAEPDEPATPTPA